MCFGGIFQMTLIVVLRKNSDTSLQGGIFDHIFIDSLEGTQNIFGKSTTRVFEQIQ